MTKFFVYPFAVDGNVLPVPDSITPDGSVSYQQGWGVDYELDPSVDPNALPFPRDQNNQLLFDITSVLNNYQTNCIPPFITTVQNLGTPYPYNINALVSYNDGINGPQIYQSLINLNTDLPSVTSSWAILTGLANAAQVSINTLQLIPGGISTLVHFQVINFDPQSLSNLGPNYSFVVKRPGIYNVYANINTSGNPSPAQQIALNVYVNGVSYQNLDDPLLTNGNALNMNGLTQIMLNVGDVIQYYVLFPFAGVKIGAGSTAFNYLGISYAGPGLL